MKLFELFDEPAKWTRENFAVHSLGYSLEPTDPDAAGFCLVGGLMRIHNCNWTKTCDELSDDIRALSGEIRDRGFPRRPNDGESIHVMRFNDEVATFDQVADLARWLDQHRAEKSGAQDQ